MAGEHLLSSPATFVLGLTERTGTNYLWDLLRVHPAYAPVSPVYEDDLLRRADLLAAYAGATVERWRRFPVSTDVEDRVLEGLGQGLLEVVADLAATGPLARPGASRLLTKTPSIEHVDLFPKLFPNSHLVVLIRDGRAVTESGLKTFGGRFDAVARLWAARARDLCRFLARTSDATVVVVRFEDLCKELEPTVTRLLEFVGLPLTEYDFQAARTLPVRGSSNVGLVGGDVQWEPVDRTAGFDPTARARDWSEAQLRRFDWLAGEELELLGYERLALDARRRRTPGFLASQVLGRLRPSSRRWPPPA